MAPARVGRKSGLVYAQRAMSSQSETAAASGWRGPAVALVDRVREAVDPRTLTVVALVAIVVLGGWLRLSGANWDGGRHLHPDERYLSQVEDAIKWPDSIGEYLDVHSSPLSPYNTETGKHYVYGQLPLFGGKLLATILGQDDYGHLNLADRRLSALIDTGSIVLVFLLAWTIFAGLGRRAATAGALVAAALYAFTVAAIQDAHFFTTDSWLVFFALLTFLLSSRAVRSAAKTSPSRFRLIHLMIGVSLGMTVACKASGGLVVVAIAVGLAGEAALAARRARFREALARACAGGLTILVAAYLSFRAVSPYAFANSNWLDVRINPSFRSALEEQRALLQGKAIVPPSYQWFLSPRVWDPLKNLIVWQLGIAIGIAALVGMVAMGATVANAIVAHVRKSDSRALGEERLAGLTLFAMLVVFVLTVFFYVGTYFAHTGRYLLPLIPFAAVAAAYVVLLLRNSPALLPVAAVLLTASLLYALAYHHIYTQPTTRVAASDWIVQHVPAGSTIVNENWDDSLPVGSDAQRFKGVTLPVFDADDDAKLRKLYDGLSGADYYFVSSPRAWRTIGRLPRRFPIMSRYYRQLFAGRLGFTEIAHFAVEPGLFGVQLHDVGAEEAFWVYDHAPVRIYQRSEPLSWTAFRNRLCAPAPAPPGC